MAASAAAINSTSAPALSVPSVQQNDVDLDDLPSSRNMDVDEDDLDLSYMDQECGMVSEPEDLVEENEDGEGEAPTLPHLVSSSNPTPHPRY